MSSTPENPPVEQNEAERLPDPQELAEQHPADVAEVIESLPTEVGVEVLESLPPESAAGALEHLEETDAEALVQDMAPAAAARLISHMSVDDAADLLGELPKPQRASILAELPRDERAMLESLLRYDPESAGGIMSPEVTALPEQMRVSDAIAALRKLAEESEQIYYTYVIDDGGVLVGVLSLRDLLLARADQKLHDIMRTQLVRVTADTDRERVAQLLAKYGYFALPVVDSADRLLGIVTVDDVVDVIRDEATEDMQRMVGAGADERIDSPVPLVLRRRLAWLVVNLATGFLAASVVGLFENTVAQLTALAVLMPIVAGQAGNTGLQSMAVMIRALATGETRGRSLPRILAREVFIGTAAGAAIGLLCGGAIYFWNAYVWHESSLLAPLIGLAMISSMVVATTSGALIPLLMDRLGFDPAQSASIILTTITDVAGFGIFLGLGAWLLATQT